MTFDFEEFTDSIPMTPTVRSAVKKDSSYSRLQYLIDNTTAIIYARVPTGDFKMTYVSNNARLVLGYAPEEMLEDQNFWFNHIHPDDRLNIFSSMALLFSEGQRTYEYRFLNSAGEYLWMSDMLRLVLDEDGSPLEVVGSLTDITRHKKMEAELQRQGEEQQALIQKLQEAHRQLLQAEKMASVGQLAAGIAHEINNPIGFINSNMNSLQKYVATLFGVIDQYRTLVAQTGLDDKDRLKFEEIENGADLDYVKEDINELVPESLDGLRRVKEIVQSLKDFSHVGESEWHEADIHHGLDSTLNIVRNEIKYKATIDKQYGTLPPVFCIISQLNQVFMNLFVNAAHAIKDHGTITISTGVGVKDGNEWAWIKIMDTGCGIPAENLNRIFEPFFTTKPIGSGTGLGLSVTYGIIKSHKGHIDVKSVVGKGTCFTIYLPVKQ
ncbi:two-component system NtrC family sensor kinase [Oxalobacteraceae bacterium GrIS 1.18]